jgi:quercetin dioxygenase-like cupin family protein
LTGRAAGAEGEWARDIDGEGGDMRADAPQSAATARAYDRVLVAEAPLERSEHGLMPVGDGWFVLNGREAEWRIWPGRGKWPRLEGGQPRFTQLGLGLTVLEPGEPMAMYHWERDQEDFLVLHGEALAIIDGEERPLRKWDLLHCPAGTRHTIVGAGDGPCVVFSVGAREKTMARDADGRLGARPGWGAYPLDQAALRRGAGVEEETRNKSAANARFPPRVSVRYRAGWLPD